jgi:hypothetical protein
VHLSTEVREIASAASENLNRADFEAVRACHFPVHQYKAEVSEGSGLLTKVEPGRRVPRDLLYRLKAEIYQCMRRSADNYLYASLTTAAKA